MNRRGSRTRAAALALAVALGLTACGSRSGAESDGPAKLSMWTFLDPNGDDPRGEALKGIVDRFNASQDKAQVEVTTINFAKIDAEVIRATASGSGPDIINVYTDQLAAHVEAGTLQPIDEYATPWLEKVGDDYLFPLDGVRFDDQLMSLPWESRVWLMWYRQDMLSQIGAQPPKTLDELASTGAAISDASGGKTTGMAIGLSPQGLGTDFMHKFIPLLWGHGGELLDEDGKAAFNSDAGVAAIEYMKQLVDEGAMGRDMLNMSQDDVLNAVKAGGVAMAIQGSFRVGAARSADGVGENLVTAPAPGLTADEPLPTMVAGQTLGIGATTEHPDEAWDFIEFYLSKESQTAFAQASVMPVLSSVYDDPSVPNAEELKQWRDYLQDYGHPTQFPGDFNRLSDLLVNAGQRMVFENAPVESTLDAVAEEYNKGKG